MNILVRGFCVLMAGVVILGTNTAYAAIWTNELGQEKEIGAFAGDSPITYIASVGTGDTIVDSLVFETISSPSQLPGLWDYYSFFGVAGATFEAEVHRLSDQSDPIIALYSGLATDTEPGPIGIFSGGSGGTPTITHLAVADDNNGIPHGFLGDFADPKLTFVLPSTGNYTLAIADYFGEGPPDTDGTVPYELHIISGASPIDAIPEPTSLLVFAGLGLCFGFAGWRGRRRM
ncbi:MAG: hypothetical protein IIA67_04210 [Planctomycetes bacterium]|nr:hypothetical protein [Planctomycetota bacterium]